VVRVATKGSGGWVTLYRLAYSENCSTFINLLDGAGNNAVISYFDKADGMVYITALLPVFLCCLFTTHANDCFLICVFGQLLISQIYIELYTSINK